jgi:hypothetical protein
MLAATSGSTAVCTSTASRGTNATGYEPCAATRWAASRATRVLPIPPGPTTVTSRAPEASRSSTAAISRSRPNRLLRGVGTGVVRGDAAGWCRPTASTAAGGSRKRSASSTARSSRSSRWSSFLVPKVLYATVSSSRIRDSSSPSRDSRFGAGALMYTSRGSPPDSWYSSSSPETCSPGATQPYRAK